MGCLQRKVGDAVLQLWNLNKGRIFWFRGIDGPAELSDSDPAMTAVARNASGRWAIAALGPISDLAAPAYEHQDRDEFMGTIEGLLEWLDLECDDAVIAEVARYFHRDNVSCAEQWNRTPPHATTVVSMDGEPIQAHVWRFPGASVLAMDYHTLVVALLVEHE